MTATGPDNDHEVVRVRTRIVITRSWCALELEGIHAALSMVRQARTHAASLDDDTLIALSHIQEGLIHGRAGKPESALACLDLVGTSESLLSPTQRWALHLNRGATCVRLGRLPEAASELDQARSIAATHDLGAHEFKAVHNLAYLSFVAGDTPGALRWFRAAEEMSPTVLAGTLPLSYAEVLTDAGLIDAARERLEVAATAAIRSGHRLELADVYLRASRCDIVAGDLSSARHNARRAIAAFRSRQASELLPEAEIVRIGIAIADGEDLTSSLHLLEAMNGRPPTTPAGRTAVRLHAQILARRGEPGAARRRLRALDDGPTDSLAAGLHDALVRALVADAEHDEPATMSHILRGNRLLAARQTQSASLEVRAALSLHGRELVSLDQERALRTGNPQDLLETIERWRAISHRIDTGATPHDDELTTRTRELRLLRQQRAEEGESAELDAAIADAERTVAAREWGLSAEQSSRPGADATVRASEVSAAAAERKTTVVEFFEHHDQLHAIAITATTTRVIDFGPAQSIVDLVVRLRRDLTARTVTAPTSPMRPVLDRASRASLAALDVAINPGGQGTGHVVIVPSGSLGALPWSLLPSLRGRPVTISPSLTRWVHGTPGVRPETTVDICALHGPGLERAAPEVGEILAIWRHAGWRAHPDSTGPASADDVVTALAGARIVHLAAHGTHERQSPMFSSVRMGDGPVFAHEFPRPIAAEHIILSACDVGRFALLAGDEPAGLAMALLGLGAESVLAAVAPVADEVAHLAMVAYHGRLAAGESAASAWAAVVADHPEAGAFCLYGSDWSASPHHGVPA